MAHELIGLHEQIFGTSKNVRKPDPTRIMSGNQPVDNHSSYPYDNLAISTRKNSILEAKSRLEFLFPTEGGKPKVITLPFFENPKVTESKNTLFATHNVIGRSSSLYTYLGSEARKLKVNFTMTLPHLIKFYRWSKAYAGPVTMETYSKDRFFEAGNQEQMAGDATPSWRPSAFRYDKKYGVNSTNEFWGLEGIPLSKDGLDQEKVLEASPYHVHVNHLIDIITYWVEIIRASCYNNNDNPIFGPPIVRLTHGILFRKIPCIVNDYNVTFDEESGYAKNTMIPRNINISLNLQELRAGNYGKFDQRDISTAAGHNLAGYEVVFDYTGGQNLGRSMDVVPLSAE